jgi:hypothetical protein
VKLLAKEILKGLPRLYETESEFRVATLFWCESPLPGSLEMGSFL